MALTKEQAIQEAEAHRGTADLAFDVFIELTDAELDPVEFEYAQALESLDGNWLVVLRDIGCEAFLRKDVLHYFQEPTLEITGQGE